MKINMWNLYNLLNYEQMEPIIPDGTSTFQYVRLAVENDVRSSTVYIGPGENYYGSGSVVISHDSDMILIENADLHGVFNQVATIIDRFASWEKRLANFESAENGIQQMLDSAQPFMPGAYYALTFGGKTLGLSCTPLSPLRPIWDEIAETPDLSYERMYTLDKYFEFSHFQQGVELSTDRAKNGAFSYSYLSLERQNHHFGFLTFCYPGMDSPRGADVILRKLAHHMIRYFVMYGNMLNLVSHNAEMLSLLLEDGSASPKLADFFQSIHWASNARYRLFAFNCGVKGQSSEVIKAARDHFSLPLFCSVGKDLVMMLNLKQEKNAEEKIPEFLGAVPGEVSCGVSGFFIYLWQAYLYAEQAIRELRRAESKTLPVCFGEAEGSSYFLDTLTEIPLAKCYINRSLLTIYHYDLVHDTEYYNTMRAYLLFSCHTSDAAKMLGIHRNTFTYRLEQLRGMVDFTEFDEAFRTFDMKKIASYQMSIFLLDRIIEDGRHTGMM